jgi:DNA uptake protein ComE-like DNA-binding protein
MNKNVSTGMKRTYSAMGCLAAICLMGLPLGAQTTLPDGPGKAQVERVCSTCHKLDTVTATRRSRADWQSVLEDMETRGAQGSDRDFIEIVDYLSKNFGPHSSSSESPDAAQSGPADSAGSSAAAQEKPGATPGATEEKPKTESSVPAKVNVNKASASELMAELKISQESATAVVHYRETKGVIKDWDALKSIPGLDLQHWEEYKDRLEF